ncbi:MAG: hypothetical protein ACRCYS_16320 [Beijerinckiaceae bacterium]
MQPAFRAQPEDEVAAHNPVAAAESGPVGVQDRVTTRLLAAVTRLQQVGPASASTSPAVAASAALRVSA